MFYLQCKLVHCKMKTKIKFLPGMLASFFEFFAEELYDGSHYEVAKNSAIKICKEARKEGRSNDFKYYCDSYIPGMFSM